MVDLSPNQRAWIHTTQTSLQTEMPSAYAMDGSLSDSQLIAHAVQPSQQNTPSAAQREHFHPSDMTESDTSLPSS